MKRWLSVLITLIAVFSIVGCDKENKDPWSNEFCPPHFLVAPIFVSPPDLGVVTSTTPTLEWSFPEVAYPYNTETGTCRPEQYRITLKKGPLFMEAMGTMIDGTLTSWTTPPLEVGAEYQWSVSPMTEKVNGPSSGIRSFFVGSPCGDQGINPPTLLEPFNGGGVNLQIPTLTWQNNSTCVPDLYHIEVATDAGFDNIVLSANTNGPVTSFTIPDPLPPCLRYYWRAAAVKTEILQSYSEPFSFFIAIEGCEPEPGTGSITGIVWNDICTLPEDGTLSDPLPYGCIAHGNSAIANGNINPGENGIANVVVRIGSGPCSASSPLGLTISDINGMFHLWSLQSQTYCLTIDPAENSIWLGSGWWTYPPQAVDQMIGSWEINLPPDENNSNANFGWQFENAGPNTYNYTGGVVYHDFCTVPHGVEPPDVLPDNCQLHSGWVTGNYHREEGEPGIPGIQVELRTPACSSPVQEITTTDENGFFAFMLQPEIPFCVTVQSTTSPNKEILQPGVWSTTPNDPVFSHPFYLNGKSNIIESFFNVPWDYSNLPKPLNPLEIPKRYPLFRPDLDINCRAGPATFWQNWAFLQKGMEFQLIAINPTRDWAQLQPSAILNPEMYPDRRIYAESLKCWVKLETGQIEGELGDLEVHKGPATPTPTPTPIPVVCSRLSESVCNNTPGCYWYKPAGTIGGICKAK